MKYVVKRYSSSIKSAIIEAYETSKPSSRMNMVEYFMRNKLKSLIEVADEF